MFSTSEINVPIHSDENISLLNENTNSDNTVKSKQINKKKKKKNSNTKTFRDKIIEIEKHIDDANDKFNILSENIKKEISDIREIVSNLSKKIENMTIEQQNLGKIMNKLFVDISLVRNKMTR